MTSLRRRIAHLLARLVIVVDPDPPMKITTRRLADDYPDDFKLLATAITDVVSGRIGGRLGLGLDPPDGPIARY